RGGTVIHCPSDCMAHYEGHPAREAARNVPKASNLPPEIGTWCYSIPSEEKGVYPLDQSDGGEDDAPETKRRWVAELAAKGRKPAAPWVKQHDAIEIRPGDFLTDKGEEVWSILEARGIDNVLMTGVHTNMCVLGRPFGLRRLASNGKNVALVRDLTDTMYNPARRPYVSHFTGNDLIVEHIEKYVCGTVTSDQVLGGEPFRFAGDDRPHVAIVLSEPEYETETTLPAFARRHLGRHFKVSPVFGDEQDGNDLPGLEVIEEADVLLLSVRRRALRPEQMALIRRFLESGRPVVGLRTASHAFSLRGKEPPEGRVVWETFDADVFGGNYTNHHGDGPETTISVADGAKGHAILAGVDTDGWTSAASLYKVSPLKSSATPLLVGTIPNAEPEPVAWTNETKFGGKAFYTSLGHKIDFEKEPFRRLLFNALFWAAG
ncbi:MAG TPA: ThuA domain-containing protein, partial [Planctomycetaceae bacterium]